MGILSGIKALLKQDLQVDLSDNMLSNPSMNNAPWQLQLMVCRNAIIYRLRKYGFIEIAILIEFLNAFCDDVPDQASYLYIKEKIKQCLDIHDNGSDYFYDMHRLLVDVEHVIAIDDLLL